MGKAPQPSLLQTRLAEALERGKISPRRASLKARLGADAARDILNGKSTDPKSRTIRALAAILKVDSRWLSGEIDEEGAPEAAEPLYLPIRYRVAAGNWREHDEIVQDFFGEGPVAPAAEYIGFDQWLESVEGDSVDQIYPSGALVHVVDALQIGYQPRNGDIVVIERSRGGLRERTVKEIVVSRNKITARGRSTNPKWNTTVDIARDMGSEDEAQIVGKVIGAYLMRR